MASQKLFPITGVGSWSRPPWLVQALRRWQDGEITKDEFDGIADEAVLLCIKYQEDAGVDIVTDGEQRRDNFYSFVVSKVSGMKLMPVSELMDYMTDRARFEEVLRALDVPAFAIKSPIVVDKIKSRNGLTMDEVDFLMAHTDRQVKMPLPGPYLLLKSSYFKGLSDKAYASEEELAEEIVKLLRDEVLALKAKGVDFIQLDEPTLSQVVLGEESTETFMCAAMATRKDPSEELELAVRLMNQVVDGIDGVRLGVHVCRGNWSRREDVLLTGNYGPMLPYLMQMNVDQLVLEYATPRAGEMEVFKEYAKQKEIGLGVVNPRTDEVESPQQIVAQVKQALQYFTPEQIFLNPDCGFGTFAERNMNTPDLAFRKLQAVHEAADELRREFG